MLVRNAFTSMALVCTVCSCATIMQPPERFLIVDEGHGFVKAITPEESKLWLRDFADDDRGGLAFWRDALKDDLVNNRGYVVIEEGAAKDSAGTMGHEFVLESTVNGRAQRELMAVFVYAGLFSDTIRVVEYVADKDTFAKEIATVRASLATIRP